MGKDISYEIWTNSFHIDESNNISQNSAWFLLKPGKTDIKSNKYKLNPGDILKIGRITLRIRDIYFSNKKDTSSLLNESNCTNINIKEMNTLKTEGEPLNNNTNINPSKTNKPNNNSDPKEKIKNTGKAKNLKKESNIFTKLEKKTSVCRICYIEEEDKDNPLVQPCICSGSMKFIHLSCLKHWISTRSCVKIDTTEKCSVYIIKAVECELCKTKFPDIIKHEGKLYALLDFSKEYENYLTLESLTLDKHRNKFIYVVSLKDKKIKIGRGHESDALLSDISVSRVHCFFVTENKKVFLEDNNSKFGSLILIQYPNIKIMDGIPLYFQVGRTYIDCRIKRPFKLFNCCDVEESSNLQYYYNQNEKQIQNHINLIVKRDYNEIDDDSQNDKINNTFEKNILNIDEKYNYTLENNEKDKISDNEYFMLKHQKLKKNITKAMIDDDIDPGKLISNNENEEKSSDSESKEENEDEDDGKINKTENNNSEENNKSNNKEENQTDNKNQSENKNNNQENEDNSEINETLKKENFSTLD